MTDEAAYRQYLMGDASGIEMLVEKYGDALILYLCRYIGDRHEAEDLMIETFARLLARERDITGEGGFKAYLFRIARNLALRHRTRCRIATVPFDELPVEICGEPNAEGGVLQTERERQLHDAMAKLKPEYREALYLVYFENMRYREAGQVLHKTEAQMTNLVHRAKNRLREILEREGFTYGDADDL